jgi:hypothetical protein
MSSAKSSRREYGTGGITWLSPRRARLRVRVPGEDGQRSKVVRVAPKDKGGLAPPKSEDGVRSIVLGELGLGLDTAARRMGHTKEVMLARGR